ARARADRPARPADRQALGRTEDARVACESFDQRAAAAAARRADRLARSRHRRLGALAARALPARARRDAADRLAQHGRGRAHVRARHHHEEGAHRGRRHAAGAAETLRPQHFGGCLPRRRALARPCCRGGAMSAAGYSPRRVGAMILRYWYLLRSSWPRLLELIYWPAVQMLMWGFLQLYVSQNAGFFARAGGTFIGAVLLWDILFRGQLGFSMSFLEEMWARNMGNLMMSPLRPGEFIAALMVMSIIRLAIGMVPVTILALGFFNFNLYAL